ncbi:MAG: ABC transporter ATP-binding protein [Pseudomonadota bacterium]
MGLSRWFETRYDALAPAQGPPPDRLGAFIVWALSGAWPTVGLLACATFLSGVSEVVAALVVGWVVDQAAAGGTAGFFAANGPALLLAAGFFMLVRPVVVSFGAALTGLAIGPGLFSQVLIRLHRHTLGQSITFFDDDFAGRLSQKQIQTATALTAAVTEICNALIFGLASAIGAVLLLGGVGLWLGLVLALWMLAYAFLIRHFLPRIRAQAQSRAEARAALSGQIVDTLSNMATVKLFAHAAREQDAAQEAVRGFRNTALGFGRVSALFRLCLMLLSGLLPVGLVGVALLLWTQGQASPGAIAAAGLIGTRLAQMSGWLSMAMMEVFSNIGEVEDGVQTLSHPHQIVDRAGAARIARATGAIRFETVSFSYGRESAALQGPADAGPAKRRTGDGHGTGDRRKISGGIAALNLSIAPGEKVALVGRSGAGKSTLLSLLLRLYDTEAGRILLDGTDIRDLNQDTLRRQIAMVRQDTAMFNRSALDNILYGNPDAGAAAAQAAAERAEAHLFIAGLRDRAGRMGYDAHLGERGVRLSGGQRQRIALARAILKDAPILALDEATSALDSETEAAVQRALAALMEGRTVIAIAHRLSTIAHMDRIVVLDAGRVAEEGTHQALLTRGGLYAGFWARQSGGFLKADGIEAAE